MSVRREINRIASCESNSIFRPSNLSGEHDVIKEESEHDKLSTIQDEEKKIITDDLEQFSPLNYLQNNTPSNAGTPSAKTLKFATKKQQTSSSRSSKELTTTMKRTKSEFVTREMRKTHAKDMQGPNEPKIEETSDSSLEEEDLK